MAKQSKTGKKKPNRVPVEDLVQVSDVGKGSAVAAGRGAKAIVINFFGNHWQLPLVFIVIIAIIVYIGWQKLQPSKMTGDFRVAVAGFAMTGSVDRVSSGDELADGVYLKLNETLSEMNNDFSITVWPPEKVGKIDGDTAAERAEYAEKISKKIGADIVVYGVVDTSERVWRVTPEFYIASENFYDAEEITGQYQLGEDFDLVGQDSIARRIELSEKFNARAQAVTKITIGLAYFSLRDFSQAAETFQSAEAISGWDEKQGKEVIYFLAGNAALKAQDFETSIIELNKSLAIDPEYARPLIALGSVYYLQALDQFNKTNIPSDIDLKLLENAIRKYEQALYAEHQPALSDISTKVHFGLGQCFLMKTYSGAEIPIEKSINEFEIVIADYGNGKNPRVREIAAEAHARLGLIYDFSGYLLDASEEYQLAADLLFDYPERQQQYQTRANDLLQANETISP